MNLESFFSCLRALFQIFSINNRLLPFLTEITASHQLLVSSKLYIYIFILIVSKKITCHTDSCIYT